ncbi:MAG: hypothetical protein ASARMPREDX12_002323 [Alectoria sarmentosa]|nr:MAG: hypothetical protein ASARMPREDX12_002323 [Alectoria sarmentosa]
MPVYELQSSPHKSSSNEAQQSQPRQGKDHWTANAYSASASFVPLLTHEIVQWLDPQPDDTILDLGCGDGLLTAKIRSSCSRIAGFDASANLIEAAQNTHGTNAGLTWNVLDCRYLEESKAIKEGEYSKILSNAALHWILRDASTRMSVFRGAYRALQPGGTFVFEMGGAGNVADVHTALLAALVHQGLAIEKAREACPWFFPSEKLMKDMLEEAGFQVEKMKLDYRPTKLTAEKEGGLEGWVRLMGANFLDVLPTKDKKEAVVREVCDVLQTVLSHEEDGSMWLGYVRLKVVARK